MGVAQEYEPSDTLISELSYHTPGEFKYFQANTN